MKAVEIAEILNQIAELLDLKGENPFKSRAYQTAARALENLDEDLGLLIENGKIKDIEGIGSHIAEKVTILYKTGKLPYYEELKASIPPGLIQLLEVPSLGPKKIKTVYEQLGVTDLALLKKACEDGNIAKLKGFGEKTQENILKGIQNREIYGQRHLWYKAATVAEEILKELKKLKSVREASYGGSLRRLLETVGDLDFVVASQEPEIVMEAFTKMPFVQEVTSKGDTKSSVRLEGGLQADLRVVPLDQYYFALHHFTGSKAHNVRMRQRALELGMSLSEWGLKSEKKSGEFVVHTVNSEEELYRLLKLNYIPPELREDMGEIEYAQTHLAPSLIELKDLKGAFHNHTVASDGEATLEEMVQAAQDSEWEYIGIADHSKSSYQANGLSAERLLAQVKTIQALNASKKFKTHVFTGLECDILPDGSLDFDSDILKELDYVVISVHSSFTQSEEQMTARIIKAIESPYVTMLGHLTGRLLLRREPYKVDIAKVIDAAIANGVIVELNADPRRLDMDWRHWHKAAEKGCLCSINPDAHSTHGLQNVKYGINIARKGWLQAKHVLNTRSLEEVKEYLQKRKSTFA